jgi:hypothetical protein
MARYFKKLSTNEWLARADNLIPMPDANGHLADVSAEYGIPVGDLASFDDASDPRSGTYLMPPPQPPTPDETELSAIDALVAACVGGTATAAQVRELVGKMAQRMRRRGGL